MGKLPDDEQEAHTRPTGWDEVAQHTEIQEVNETFGQWRFQGLPTEASSTCGRPRVAARVSAMVDVIDEESAEVIVPESRTGRMKEA